MKVRTFLQRKFKSRWSDLQLLVMLTIAEEQLATWKDLMDRCEASEAGVWKAVSMLQDQNCAETFVIEGKVYYYLNENGRKEIEKLLK